MSESYSSSFELECVGSRQIFDFMGRIRLVLWIASCSTFVEKEFDLPVRLYGAFTQALEGTIDKKGSACLELTCKNKNNDLVRLLFPEHFPLAVPNRIAFRYYFDDSEAVILEFVGKCL